MGNTLDYWLNGLRTWRSAYRRILAADALGRMGAPAVEPLVELLADDSPEIRRAALQALGEIGDERAVAPVAGLLGDADPPIRVAAAVALGEMGSPAVEALIEAMAAPAAEARRAAAQALAQTGDHRAVQPLVQALSDADPSTRIAAADGLRVLGVQAGVALDPLRRLLWTEWNGSARVAIRRAAQAIAAALREAPSELEAASAPEGRGTELSSAEAPAGRGTELTSAKEPPVTGADGGQHAGRCLVHAGQHRGGPYRSIGMPS